jgi:hypothetical protein
VRPERYSRAFYGAAANCCFTASLLLFYCCFVQVLMGYAGYERCFTASLLLL